jgi:Tfp pilus assembly protein PilE
MKANQKGFSAVEVILVLVVAGLIGVVGFVVYKNHNKTSDSTSTTTATKTSTTSKTAQTADPYTDWQSYCDTRAKACFKYPQGWNLEYGASINTQLNSPDATLTKFSESDQKYPTGQYAVQMHLGDTDSAYGTSAPFSFTTKSIEAVAGGSQLKVVSGYDPSVNIDSYSIVDTAFIQKYGLAVGKTSQNVMNLSYTNSPTSTSYAFFANDASFRGSGTTKNVTDWFASDYAKQSLLILKSYKAQ